MDRNTPNQRNRDEREVILHFEGPSKKIKMNESQASTSGKNTDANNGAGSNEKSCMELGNPKEDEARPPRSMNDKFGTHQIEEVATKRGGRKFIIDGFSYVKKKSLKNNREKFECTERQKLFCKAFIIVENGEVVHDTIPSHRHSPDPALLATLRMKKEIRERAENTLETPQQIIQNVVLCGSDMEAAANLPSVDNMKRNIRSIRQSMHGSSKMDATSIINANCKLHDGTNILLYNSFEHSEDINNNQMLILGTMESASILQNSDHWYADGTFDVCPSSYYQVYTIHGLRNGKVYPCMYVLLSNKKETMYK